MQNAPEKSPLPPFLQQLLPVEGKTYRFVTWYLRLVLFDKIIIGALFFGFALLLGSAMYFAIVMSAPIR